MLDRKVIEEIKILNGLQAYKYQEHLLEVISSGSMTDSATATKTKNLDINEVYVINRITLIAANAVDLKLKDSGQNNKGWFGDDEIDRGHFINDSGYNMILPYPIVVRPGSIITAELTNGSTTQTVEIGLHGVKLKKSL